MTKPRPKPSLLAQVRAIVNVRSVKDRDRGRRAILPGPKKRVRKTIRN